MNQKCKCGGWLATWTGNEGSDLDHKGLSVCIDCGQRYIKINGELNFISVKKFNEVVKQREALFLKRTSYKNKKVS